MIAKWSVTIIFTHTNTHCSYWISYISIVKTYFILKSSIHRTAHFFHSICVCRCGCLLLIMLTTFFATASAYAAVCVAVVHAQNKWICYAQMRISISRPQPSALNRHKQIINVLYIFLVVVRSLVFYKTITFPKYAFSSLPKSTHFHSKRRNAKLSPLQI